MRTGTTVRKFSSDTPQIHNLNSTNTSLRKYTAATAASVAASPAESSGPGGPLLSLGASTGFHYLTSQCFTVLDSASQCFAAAAAQCCPSGNLAHCHLLPLVTLLTHTRATWLSLALHSRVMVVNALYSTF